MPWSTTPRPGFAFGRSLVWYAIDGAAAIAIGVTALFVPAILRLEHDGAEIMRRRSLITESTGKLDAESAAATPARRGRSRRTFD